MRPRPLAENSLGPPQSPATAPALTPQPPLPERERGSRIRSAAESPRAPGGRGAGGEGQGHAFDAARAPLVCLALFVTALLVRLYRLDAQSLWLDEGSSWELSRAGWATLASELLNPSAAYPLYHLMLKGWMALFGDSEFALRLPSALAGAMAVPVVYLAAGEVGDTGTRGHGDTGTRGQGDTGTRGHGDTGGAARRAPGTVSSQR